MWSKNGFTAKRGQFVANFGKQPDSEEDFGHTVVLESAGSFQGKDYVTIKNSWGFLRGDREGNARISLEDWVLNHQCDYADVTFPSYYRAETNVASTGNAHFTKGFCPHGEEVPSKIDCQHAGVLLEVREMRAVKKIDDYEAKPDDDNLSSGCYWDAVENKLYFIEESEDSDVHGVMRKGVTALCKSGDKFKYVWGWPGPFRKNAENCKKDKQNIITNRDKCLEAATFFNIKTHGFYTITSNLEDSKTDTSGWNCYLNNDTNELVYGVPAEKGTTITPICRQGETPFPMVEYSKIGDLNREKLHEYFSKFQDHTNRHLQHSEKP